MEGWGLVSVKSEIIQGAEADCIRVRILRECFRAPAYIAEKVHSFPRCAAIPGVPYGAILRKARMLRRCVESDIGYSGRRICSGVKLKGLYGGIKVLVIDSVFIVPAPVIWSCHLITNPENAIVPGIGFDPNYRSSGPGRDGRLLSHGGAKRAKIEIRRTTTHALLLIGNVVKHVALTWVSLAPGIFVLHHVLCFGKIGGAWVLGRDQVARFNQNSVRRHVMIVVRVVIRSKT